MLKTNFRFFFCCIIKTYLDDTMNEKIWLDLGAPHGTAEVWVTKT